MRKRRPLPRPCPLPPASRWPLSQRPRLAHTPHPTRLCSDLERFGKVVKLAAFKPFTSAAHALENINAVSESSLTDDLRHFLEQNLPKVRARSRGPVGGGASRGLRSAGGRGSSGGWAAGAWALFAGRAGERRVCDIECWWGRGRRSRT